MYLILCVRYWYDRCIIFICMLFNPNSPKHKNASWILWTRTAVNMFYTIKEILLPLHKIHFFDNLIITNCTKIYYNYLSWILDLGPFLSHHGCKILSTYYMQQYCCTVDASKLSLHVFSVHPTKCLQRSPCKMFAASTLQKKMTNFKMFAASTLQNVCSIHPAKCLQHPPCK